MIIRAWRAVAGSDEVLAAYADHLRRTTFVEMAELPGHLGATLARKVNGIDNELIVMSFWEDMASAGHFMQGAFDDAVVKPGTQKLLKSFDLKVEYFETVVSSAVAGGALSWLETATAPGS
jgi:heme-degrading monooxygenase HmoA